MPTFIAPTKEGDTFFKNNFGVNPVDSVIYTQNLRDASLELTSVGDQVVKLKEKCQMGNSTEEDFKTFKKYIKCAGYSGNFFVTFDKEDQNIKVDKIAL